MCIAVEEDEYESIPNSTVQTQMLAGALAGITEHVVTYPLDVVKTRMQIAHSGATISLYQSMNSVYIKEGLRAFTRGIKPVVLSAGPAHALYFAAYEQCKLGIKPMINNDHVSHALSGAVATLFHDGFVTPFDVVKQRMQLGKLSLTQSAKEIYTKEGFRAFYLSFPTTIAMSIPFQMIQFTCYESAREKFNPSGAYNPLSHCLAGGIAGACASFITNPLDVVKTALQTRGIAKDTSLRNINGFKDTVTKLISVDGFKWCFRGVQARMLSHIPSTAVAWTTYEFLKFTITNI